MFKFKIIDRETYSNLIDICNRLLARNNDLLSVAKELLKRNEELTELNKKLLDLNELSVKEGD